MLNIYIFVESKSFGPISFIHEKNIAVILLGQFMMEYFHRVTRLTVSSTAVLLRLCYFNSIGPVMIFCEILDEMSCHVDYCVLFT